MHSSIKRKGLMVFFAGLAILGFMAIDMSFAQLNSWVPTGSMSSARRDHTATLLLNGKVLIIAGTADKSGVGQPAELYDPASGLFESAGTTLFWHSQGSTATLLEDGRVLIVGGWNAQTFAEIYDPVTGLFTATGTLGYPHCYHSATRLPDGRVLIAGGHSQGPPNYCPITENICEIFDPSLGTFMRVCDLNLARAGHTATLLDDGRVLLTGGTYTFPDNPCHGDARNTAELYDPASGTFSLIPMQVGRYGHTATKLMNGKILIVGGPLYADPSNLPYADIFDPGTNTFSPTGPMNIIHMTHTATLLLNGQVLIAGGFSAAGPITRNIAEIYDPLSGQFSLTGNMTQPRQEHTATLLMDGRVLVAGGASGQDVYHYATAELYLAPSTPEDAIDQITEEIPPLPGSSEISLTIQLDEAMGKLQDARTFLKAGNLQLAKLRYCQSIEKVGVFIYNVQQKVPELIAPETGQKLIADAEILIDLIEKEMENAGLTPC